MIRLLTCMIMLLALCLPTTAFAQSEKQPELRLRQGSSLEGFDYTYISPWMLKSMQQKELKELENIPVDKVKQIEILKTKTDGNNNLFKSIINKLSDEMTLIGYNRDRDKGVKICADVSAKNIVERILVIQWKGFGLEHNVIYIVGTFTPEEVNSIFHF